MPINPAYQFMNSAADLSDKNQFMDFLRRDAQAKGFDSNYSAGLANDQQMMNTMAAQQPQPMAQPRPVPQPQQPGAQAFTRPMPQVNTEIPEVPQQPQPEAVENTGAQGYEGLGNFDKLPMTQEPQSANHNDQQSQELQRFEQTKLARQGSEMGMDPRQLYVALAQFSAGMGNIKGRDTKSTAGDFYNMQKGYENQDEARKMRQEEFAARMAPKSVDPLNQEYLKAKIAEMNRKGMPAPATELDPARQDLYKSQADWYRAKAKNEQLGSQRPMAPTKDGKPQADMLNPKQIKSATDLRKEYQNHPVTKTSNDLNAMWGKVREVMDNPSAAGDMASIFLFMKALDPGSTVREGEYKSAAEATSALGRVEQSLKKAGTGQNLTPEQRADFRSIMEKFYRAQMKSQKRVDDQYKGLAGRTGVDPQNLLINDSSQPSAIKSVNDLPDVR